jgi:tRNA-dihydrouridine synthase
MEMKNFWKILPSPHFALAPMEDVTDTVFRELVAGTSAPGKLQVVFTEFMSVDGYLHDKGRDKVKHRLLVSAEERALLQEKGIRIVAQIWGSDPEKFYRAARDIADEERFDGLDINMGCPVKKIVKHNACSALINVPEIAKEIVLATREGSGLPVSVKTRIGFNHVVTEEWINHLLEVRPAAITIHGRTQKMQSEGMADWNEVRKAVELRDALQPGTRILGNGDVSSYADGLQRAMEYRADGVMVGRGIFHDPFFFAAIPHQGHESRLLLLKQHLERFDTQWGTEKNYAILKRFFKIYVHSFDGAGEMRALLMDTRNCREALDLVRVNIKTPLSQ